MLREVEARVLFQDSLLQVAQLGRWGDTYLVSEKLTSPIEGTKCLGLTSAAIQSQHGAARERSRVVLDGQCFQFPVNSRCRPTARSASMRASSAASLSSRRRVISGSTMARLSMSE